MEGFIVVYLMMAVTITIAAGGLLADSKKSGNDGSRAPYDVLPTTCCADINPGNAYEPKPGSCPVINGPGGWYLGDCKCEDACIADVQCADAKKCCRTACGNACLQPTSNP